jgi:hypothetical protein
MFKYDSFQGEYVERIPPRKEICAYIISFYIPATSRKVVG